MLAALSWTSATYKWQMAREQGRMGVGRSRFWWSTLKDILTMRCAVGVVTCSISHGPVNAVGLDQGWGVPMGPAGVSEDSRCLSWCSCSVEGQYMPWEAVLGESESWSGRGCFFTRGYQYESQRLPLPHPLVPRARNKSHGAAGLSVSAGWSLGYSLP